MKLIITTEDKEIYILDMDYEQRKRMAIQLLNGLDINLKFESNKITMED